MEGGQFADLHRPRAQDFKRNETWFLARRRGLELEDRMKKKEETPHMEIVTTSQAVLLVAKILGSVFLGAVLWAVVARKR